MEAAGSSPASGEAGARRLPLKRLGILGAAIFAGAAVVGVRGDWSVAFLSAAAIVGTVGGIAAYLFHVSRQAKRPWQAWPPDSANVVSVLRSHRRVGYLLLVAAVVAAVLFLAGVNAEEGHAAKLERIGIAYHGSIVSGDAAGGRTMRSVTVSIPDRTNAPTVYVGDSGPVYYPGDPVIVLVNPANPNDLTIQGETNGNPTLVYPTIVALLSIFPLAIGGLVTVVPATLSIRLAARHWMDRHRLALVVSRVARGNRVRCLVAVDGEEPTPLRRLHGRLPLDGPTTAWGVTNGRRTLIALPAGGLVWTRAHPN